MILRRWSSLLLLLVAFSQGNASPLTARPSREAAGIVQFRYASYDVGEAAGQATIELTRSNGSGSLSVAYQTSNNTADAGSDYVGTTGTVWVTFLDGETSKSITILIENDDLNEDNETIFVDLAEVTEGSIGTPSRCTLTILDDDPLPSFSISHEVSVIEGNSGTTDAVFIVSLSAPSGRTVQVDCSTQNNTASEGSDFLGIAGTLVFVEGTTTQSIAVAVKGDVINEANEKFFVVLSNPSNATIADIQGTGTILDDDQQLPEKASISDVRLAEGDNGTPNMVFTVTLSEPSISGGTKVEYATSSGSATTGSDFIQTSGTLDIPGGYRSRTITVPVIDDNVYETEETFYVNIFSATSAFAPRRGTGTITDNDYKPTISISSMPVTEGNSGTTVAPFVVTLSNPSSEVITVDFATGNGTATSGTDYLEQIGQLVFLPGEVSKTIDVVVNGDTNFEPNESFAVNLSNASNATIAVAQSTDQILNDDTDLPTISINDFTITETNKGFVNALLTVTLSSTSTKTVSVKYATADGTANAGKDYVATNGTLTFPAGKTSQDITVKVNGDRKKETNDSFSVNLTSPEAGLLGKSTGVVTIVNDDGLPKLWIAGEHMKEGNSGSKAMVFTVKLQKKPSSTVTVDFATANGTALAGSDYVATSGTLAFASGVTEKKISVVVLGDLLYEPDESFTVRLSNPAGASIQDGSATGTIQNDESRPALTISDATVDEGPSGSVTATFTVRLSNPSSKTVTVNYATANGTASSSSDYLAASGRLTFIPGETSKSILISVNGDLVTERDEEFFVRLSRASDASICDATGKGVIRNDDAPAISCRFDDLVTYIRGLSAEVFRKTSEKNRSDLIDGLNDAKNAFQGGNNKTAQSKMKDVLKHINDRGAGGWIVLDAVRLALSQWVSELSIALDQAMSLATKDGQVFELSEDVQFPLGFGLAQNYPNPFNPTTTIQYILAEPAMVSLKIYDMVGREVASLVEANQGAGRHSVQFNGERLTSGTYVYRLQAGSYREARKLTLTK